MLPYHERAAPLNAAAALRQLVITRSSDHDLFGSSFDEPISLSGLHPTTGLDLIADAARVYRRIRACLTTTQAARIPRWCSRIPHGR
jgi:hypothetical protein